MNNCKKCGKAFQMKDDGNVYLCDACFSKLKQKGETDLPSLTGSLIPNRTFSVIGVAYWDKAATFLGSGVAFLFFGLLAGKEHRVGIVAVSDTELFVLDLGLIVGEFITIETLQKQNDKPSVKQASLNSLRATWKEKKMDMELSITGGLKLKAVFPTSFSDRNPAKVREIVAAIDRTH